MADNTATMTAAVTTAHGDLDVIEVRADWPRPSPAPGEALVEVAAAGINNTDLWSRQGAYGTTDDPDAVVGWQGVPLDFPRIQGGDICGRVSAVGDTADEGWIGRRVLVDPVVEYENGFPASIVGSETDGGFADFHVARLDQLHDVNGSPLSDEQLACLPIAYGTALGMVEAGDCREGERVLVTGASGGVGSAAVQILAARGCHVVAQTSSPKADQVAASGPTEIFVRGRDRLVDLAEVDAVLDVVGGSSFNAVVDRLRDGGRLVTVGAIAGPVVSLDLRRLYLRRRRLIGSTMHTAAQFAALAELAREGAVDPHVAAVYPIEDIAEAQRRFERKDFVGKLVIVPGSGG